MAERNSSDDDFNPRHRIVGAIILVALAVIVLPFLLTDRPPEERSGTSSNDAPAPATRVVTAPVPVAGEKPVARNTPEKPATAATPATTTRTVPVPVGDAEPSGTPSAGNRVSDQNVAIAGAALAPPSAPVKAESQAATPAKPAKTAKAEPARPATTKKGWMVQVGAFSQPENAHRLQEKLKAGGYNSVLDPPRADKGHNVKVEVGPYADEAAARAVATRLQNELGIKGIVRAP
jgi:DedD protein